jgi:serine/threonine-protein kinase
VGPYRVIARIAAGGFCTVWKAHPLRDRKTTVALKVMRPEKARSRADRRRFAHEWKLCRKLHGTGLLEYLDYGEHESCPFVSMEYFPGRSLALCLDDPPDGFSTQISRIAAQTAEALTTVHSAGVVHRDMKPGNVLVADGGVRLIDFSIAQTRFQRILPVGDGGLHGTPAYMAPEVIQGGRASTASDLYSLGVVIFQMLAGRLPFVGDNDNAVLTQHVKSAPPRLSRFNSDVSPALDKTVASLLAKDPGARPADAGGLAKRLRSTPIYVNT